MLTSNYYIYSYGEHLSNVTYSWVEQKGLVQFVYCEAWQRWNLNSQPSDHKPPSLNLNKFLRFLFGMSWFGKKGGTWLLTNADGLHTCTVYCQKMHCESGGVGAWGCEGNQSVMLFNGEEEWVQKCTAQFHHSKLSVIATDYIYLAIIWNIVPKSLHKFWSNIFTSCLVHYVLLYLLHLCDI